MCADCVSVIDLAGSSSDGSSTLRLVGIVLGTAVRALSNEPCSVVVLDCLY